MGAPDCLEDLPVAGYQITGAHEALLSGGSTILEAEALGVGAHDALTWTLVDGPGTLEPLGAGRALYTAPTAPLGDVAAVTLKVAPACCPNQGDTVGLTLAAPQLPWVTGPTNPVLKGVDQAVMKFMYDRCTGAAVVGINWKGVSVYRRGFGRSKGSSTPGRPEVDCGPADPTATPVYPDSPIRIGSSTKPITAAMVRETVETRLGQAGRLPDPDDYPTFAAWRLAVNTTVESVRVLDAQLDLVPKELRDILGSCTWIAALDGFYVCTAGAVAAPAPVSFNDVTPPTACDSQNENRGYNGSVCQIVGGGTAACCDPGGGACQCPPGFSGSTCRQAVQGPGSVLSLNGADSRWRSMTLGHIFTHRAGLPNGVVPQSTVLANLFALRGYHEHWFDDIEDVGQPLHEVNPAFPAPAAGVEPSRQLGDINSTYEYILAEAGRNLDGAPGQAPVIYSNLGFVLLHFITEHTRGLPNWEYGGMWGGSTVSLFSHFSSRLDLFVRSNLGGWPGDDNDWGATRSIFGMFMARSPNPLMPPGSQTDPTELEPRDYLNGVWSPPVVDRKGIVCEPTKSGTCTWKFGVVDQFGNIGDVPYGTDGEMMEAGAGALITEANLYLRFMRKYITGYKSDAPSYGRRRAGFNESSGHTGKWVGGRSIMRQIGWTVDLGSAGCNARYVRNIPGDSTWVCPPGGVCCTKSGYECVNGNDAENALDPMPANNRCVQATSYRIPLVTPFGDYIANPHPLGSDRCVLPEGLDVFIATNQSTDPVDADGRDYDFPIDVVVRALCEVDWPASPLALAGKSTQVAPPSP